MRKSITAHLISQTSSSPLYASATRTHPFLVSAADGTLSEKLLSYWLFQDRIYASQAYPRFIGSLISRIPFRYNPSSTATATDSQTSSIGSTSSTTSPSCAQHILQILVFSLQNVVREVKFFDDTSREWGLDIDGRGWKERKGTRDYTAEMVRVSSSGAGLEEGLLFLWAMEQVYFDVWSTIHDALGDQDRNTSEPPSNGRRALRSLAENWSNIEFKAFVDDLACIVDDIYQNLDDQAWYTAEGVWQRVLELEQGFWPAASESEQ